MDNNYLTCEYCGVRSPKAGVKECLACGTLLPEIKASGAAKPARTSRSREDELTELAEKPSPMAGAIGMGTQAEDLLHSLLYTRSLFWRMSADAAVIAMVAFGIGLIGGATGMGSWGLLGAGLLGATVGYTIKSYLWTFLGAPVGVVLGAMACGLIWALRLSPQSYVFVVSVFAIWASQVGSAKMPYKHRRFIDKLRPFLGLFGGLAFGLLGNLIGAGLHSLALRWL